MKRLSLVGLLLAALGLMIAANAFAKGPKNLDPEHLKRGSDR